MEFNDNRPELPQVQSNDIDWRRQGVCAEADPDMFFRANNLRGRAREEFAARAIAICNGCPVKQECREMAIENGEQYGIWGGMTEEELAIAIKERKTFIRLNETNTAS